MHVNICDTTKFVAAINAGVSSLPSVDMVGTRVKEGCLTVVIGSKVQINDGGHQAESPGYEYVNASSLLSEIQSNVYFKAFKEKLAASSNKDDKLYIVGEAFVMFGGKYEIKFTGDLDNKMQSSLNTFFDGLLELKSKTNYTYDGRTLVIEIDPFERKIL